MEIIDKFFDDLQDLYDFERGLINERYLILKERELPALEIKIESSRGIHKKIKNEIIVAGIKSDYINTYLVNFNDALYLIELLIEDRLKDELINNLGDKTFEIVSRFKSLAWTMRMEIQSTITFLKLVLDPEAPERERKELFERLRQKNIELNTPPFIGKGYYLGYEDTQLKKLYELIKDKYLDPETNEENFINAFNGKELNTSFIPIVWKEPTKGACFISAFTESKNPWTKIEPIFETARYKILLDNSRKNGTKDHYINDFNQIKEQLIKH